MRLILHGNQALLLLHKNNPQEERHTFPTMTQETRDKRFVACLSLVMRETTPLQGTRQGHYTVYTHSVYKVVACLPLLYCYIAAMRRNFWCNRCIRGLIYTKKICDNEVGVFVVS